MGYRVSASCTWGRRSRRGILCSSPTEIGGDNNNTNNNTNNNNNIVNSITADRRQTSRGGRAAVGEYSRPRSVRQPVTRVFGR